MTGEPASHRLLGLRYDGTCSACETPLARRTVAWWYREEKRIVCTACQPEDPIDTGADPSADANTPPPASATQVEVPDTETRSADTEASDLPLTVDGAA